MGEQASKKQEVAVQESKEITKFNTDFSKGIFGTSDNFMMATQMAKAFASSTIVPKEYQGNFANGLVAIEMAVRMQTSPLMVMQGLDVIQGRPSWRSQFLIGMVNSSGKYEIELQFEETKDKNGKPFGCYCWTTRNGRKVTGPEVTMDMAKDEKWLEKNGSKWKTMPQIMLRYRAASFFVSMNCPELKFGLYTKEEIIDIGSEDGYVTVENMAEQVQKEIAENANVQEFPMPEESDAVEREESSAGEEVPEQQAEPEPAPQPQKPDWA
jgi:hypothetical protein